jgi:hypothetical protein
MLMTDTASKDAAAAPTILPDNLLPTKYVKTNVIKSAVADIKRPTILISYSFKRSVWPNKAYMDFNKYNGKLPYANHLGFKVLLSLSKKEPTPSTGDNSTTFINIALSSGCGE